MQEQEAKKALIEANMNARINTYCHNTDSTLEVSIEKDKVIFKLDRERFRNIQELENYCIKSTSEKIKKKALESADIRNYILNSGKYNEDSLDVKVRRNGDVKIFLRTIKNRSRGVMFTDLGSLKKAYGIALMKMQENNRKNAA